MAAAQHYLKRISYANTDLEAQNKAAEAVTQATTLYDVNKAILGGDYGQGISNTYDAELEKGLLAIDLTTLYRALDQAVTAIERQKAIHQKRFKHYKQQRDSRHRTCGKNVYSRTSDYLANGGPNSFG